VVPVQVAVFALHVDFLWKDWKEATERERIWVPQTTACAAVKEVELSRLFSEIDHNSLDAPHLSATHFGFHLN
jgi:hypothetical protein